MQVYYDSKITQNDVDNEILAILFIINLSVIDNILFRIRTKKKKRSYLFKLLDWKKNLLTFFFVNNYYLKKKKLVWIEKNF